MQLPSWARDAGLVALVVAAVALAGYVAVRDPGPDQLTAMAPAVLPSAASPSPSPEPTAVIPVLLLRTPMVPVGHVVAAAPTLRWQLTSAFAPPVTAAQLSGKQVVVVVAGEGSAVTDEVVASAQQAAQVARAVRALSPSVQLVMVAPLGVNGRPLDAARDLLRRTAAELAADFVDPVGSRWLQSRPELVRNSALTPQAAPVLGALVARALQRAAALHATPATSFGSASSAPSLAESPSAVPVPSTAG